MPAGRVRRAGGGRKPLFATDATLPGDLKDLLDGATRGDPMAPLLWTAKSLRKLAAELKGRGHRIGHNSVAAPLRSLGDSLQGNRKTLEAASHPDRDTQFLYIDDQVKVALAAGAPTISLDTRKKDLVGDFKNGGREYRAKGDPEKVRVHDAPIPEPGRASPYGVYDIADNAGWVSVGIDHDTASFAAGAIRRWWYSMGRARYPNAAKLTITADGGGSNGSRVRLWKLELQALADELGLEITVCHLPPGTSKWNRIEHRLFSFITRNWRGRPLVSYQTIVQLIAATTTKTGRAVRSELDTNTYPKGPKPSSGIFCLVANTSVAKGRPPASRERVRNPGAAAHASGSEASDDQGTPAGPGNARKWRGPGRGRAQPPDPDAAVTSVPVLRVARRLKPISTSKPRLP